MRRTRLNTDKPHGAIRVAIIDVGSNAVKLLISSKLLNGKIYFDKDISVVNKIASKLDEVGEITGESLERLTKCLDDYIKLARNYCDLENIKLISTTIFRKAKNAKALKQMIFDNWGLEIEILSEERECELMFDCILNDKKIIKHMTELTVFDLAGGNMDMSTALNGKILTKRCLPMGVLGFTEQYIGQSEIDPKEITQLRKYARDFFEEQLNHDIPQNIIVIGGSAINLARICREIPENRTEDIHGYELRIDNLEILLDGMCALSAKKRNTLIGLQEGRYDSIVSACIIFLEFLIKAGVNSAVVSTYGLRHKVATNLLEELSAKEAEERKKLAELEEQSNIE